MKGILLINASQFDDLNRDANGTSTDSDLRFHDRQKLLQHQLKFDNDAMEEREKNIAKIEKDVLDINKVMTDLNSLVNMQRESVGMKQFNQHNKLIFKYNLKYCFYIFF